LRSGRKWAGRSFCGPQAWTAQQLREAFPWNQAPRYLIHDRDSAFHGWTTTAALGIEEVLTAPRSPWQNAYVERLIGSIRRECLDHIVIINARGLRRVLDAYVDYYLKSRTHLSLNKDAPISRSVAASPDGRIVAVPQLGGLHHRYERRAS
jgi:putative transposase